MLETFAQSYQTLFLILHLLSFAVGVGAATLMDITFARYLLSLEGENWYPGLYRSAGRLIWIALIFIVLSGLGLFLADVPRLLASSKFFAKMLVVSVIIINGLIFNSLFAPRLALMFGEENSEKRSLHNRSLRRSIFASGAVSLTSWYIAVILGGLSTVTLSLMTLLGLYATSLSVAISGSLLLEAWFSRRLKLKTSEASRGVASELLKDLQTYNTLFSKPRH